MPRKTKLAPQKAIPLCSEIKAAWWYENAKSIEVYIQAGNSIYPVRICRAALASWMKRTQRAKP